MNKSSNRGWIRFYLALAPVGTLLATVGIVLLAGAWPPWSDKATLEFTGKLVPLAAVCYGTAVWILELVGAGMFWAWNKYQSWKATDRRNTQLELIRMLRDAGVEIPADVLAQINVTGATQKEQDSKEPFTV